MRSQRVWARLLGVESCAVVEGVELDEAGEKLVVRVRVRRPTKRRCGVCGERVPGFDQGEGRRQWRAPDLGTVRAYLEAAAPRVSCPVHGVVVAQVPWARHNAGHTYAFDDMAAWMAAHCSKSAVSEALRVTWRTVGAIVTRVVADARLDRDPLDGLRRIGIDEISYKRGHKYLTVVVDHDRGQLVWAAVGRDKATLGKFFDELGEKRCAALRLVSADGADWIATVVKERCPDAVRCADPFHVVAWAGKALDEVRRRAWATGRRKGQTAAAAREARYALWKNPEDLTVNQQAALDSIAETNHTLFRAYLLKEQLRQVFHLRGERGIKMLGLWIQMARQSDIPAFRDLAVTVELHRPSIEASLTHNLSNGLVESVNTKIRLLTRVAFGFRSPNALIALAMLTVGGYCPHLPGRTKAKTHG